MARLFCFLCCAVLVGCNYNTTGRSAGNVGNIYIPFFADETSGERAPELGVRLTEMLVMEFMSDQAIRVYQGTSERDLADKELIGTVKRLSESILSRAPNETEEEYRVVVTCSIQYSDLDTGQTIWQDGNVFGDGNYRIEAGDDGFEAALEEALEEVVQKVLDKTIRAW
jgi:hypothetical protein